MKKTLSLLVALALFIEIFAGLSLNRAEAVSVPYNTNGLVSYYDSKYNNGTSYSANATVWKDLVGANNITVANNAGNHFTEKGYLSSNAQNNFPTAIKNLINGNNWTMEIEFGSVKCTGSDFSTFVNSANDNFALFRRSATDDLEFKFAGVAKDARPKVYHGAELLPHSLVTITYNVGGNVIVYINGVKKSIAPCNAAMNADSLFFGNATATKSYEAYFKSMRFYNRTLSASEVKSNAAADGYSLVTNGLVSKYDGATHSSNSWTDSVSGNNIPVSATSANYWTGDGLYVSNGKVNFPTSVVNVINGNEFTFEVQIGYDFTSTGSSYNTLVSSTNDNFALFRRINGNNLEFKWAGKAADYRPIVSELNGGGADAFLPGSLITITYKVGGNVCLYVNGALLSQMPCDRTMGADDLFFGHTEATRTFGATFKAIRVYNRALSSEEVTKNAQASANADTLLIYSAKDYVTVEQPVTNVVGTLSVIRKVNSAEELTEVLALSGKPSTLIFKVNADNNVIADNGTVIGTVEGVIESLNGKIIPAFYMSDSATVTALVGKLTELGYSDGFFISADPALVKQVRALYPKMSTAIDFTGTYHGKSLTKAQCINIRKTMKINGGMVAMLPTSLCDFDTVQYLYEQIVNVWAVTPANSSAKDIYASVLSGAMGVVTDDTAGVLAAATSGVKSKTMTRLALNIAHRGYSGVWPDNTLEGSIAGYEAGGNVVENDIYISADDEIVIMHDIVSSTCNTWLNMETSTLAQLKGLVVNAGYQGTQYDGCEIPTLREYFEEFKGKDYKVFIEIKSAQHKCVDKMAELIEEYDMYDQVNIITFLEDQINYMRANYPELSIGLLTSNANYNGNTPLALRNLMAKCGTYNSTVNPTKGYASGAATQREMAYRGLSIYPWTFTTQAQYNEYFLLGYGGLTGNFPNYMSNYDKHIDVTNVKDGDAFAKNSSLTVKATATKYSRATNNISSSIGIKIIEGSNIATVSGNTLTFNSNAGNVTFVAYYTSNTAGTAYTLYEQPITIRVGSGDSPFVVSRDTIKNKTKNEEYYKVGSIPNNTQIGKLSPEIEELSMSGWFGVQGRSISSFGYSINGGTVVYNSAFKGTAGDDVKNAVATSLGTDDYTAARFAVTVPVDENTHTIKIFAKDSGERAYLIWTAYCTTESAGEATRLYYQFEDSPVKINGLSDSSHLDSFDAAGYSGKGLAMAIIRYNSAIYLGNIDLSMYESVTIKYSTHKSMIANPSDAGHTYAIGLKATPSSFGYASTPWNPKGLIAYKNCSDATGTGTQAQNERILTIPLNTEYTGPVYLTGYINGGNECCIVSAEFTPRATGHYTRTYERCDMNTDGSVDAIDAIAILKHSQNSVFTVYEEDDISGDGNFDQADAIYLLKHIFDPSTYAFADRR